jgi:catechol 2,3-dioxygenase-like lactoylglutathione lyase family enzyme
VLHVVERSPIPEGGGVLDHIAFSGKDARAYLAKLKARGIKYDLRRLPEPGHAGGLWQLFFFDPSGARVEIDFAATETVEGHG